MIIDGIYVRNVLGSTSKKGPSCGQIHEDVVHVSFILHAVVEVTRIRIFTGSSTRLKKPDGTCTCVGIEPYRLSRSMLLLHSPISSI